MRIFYEDPGEPGLFLVNQTSSAVTLSNVGSYVRGVVGVGNAYLVYSNSFDPGFNFWNGFVADWNGAPLCNNDPAINNADIMAMLDDPPAGKITAPPA